MTRGKRLLLAIEPLRQTDFSLVSEIVNGIPPGTPTAEAVKDTITNLVGYLQHEKDYPEGVEYLQDGHCTGAARTMIEPKPGPELYVSDKAPKPKRKGKARRRK